MSDKSFSKMKFKSEATKKLGLPDVGYPVPTEKFPMLIMSGGEVKRELLIYWMMDYLSLNDEDREFYEIQLLKCAEKFAVSSGQSEFWYSSDNDSLGNYKKWSAYLGNVDLKRHIVTVQSSKYPDVIYSAFSRFEDSKDFMVSCYTAPSLDGVNFIRIYGQTNLSPDRPFNSFDHLEHSTKKMGTVMSSSSGDDYPVNWEYGVGWNSPTYFDDAYQFAQQLNPIPSDWVRYFIRIVERVESDEKYKDLI
jgi:hypothetical protein